ncbi:MAG: hypothetical protein GXX91_05060 [Verrucomicrobiaceae bacterium]|nr:hypothetical protein [Verrucomicrobiaceae bacterium]
MKFCFPLPSFLVLAMSGIAFETAGAVDYQEEIRPILNKKCFKCHTGPRAKGGLRMDSPEDFAKRIGGEDPVIVPGDPSKSLLTIKAGLPRSDGDAMPPPPARERGAEAMTSAELSLVQKWVSLGAKFEAGEADSATAAAATPSAAPAMENKIQTWTNSTGASLQAAFVSLSGSTVTLRKEDGSQFNYPLANLSGESQALARELGGK